MLWHPTAYFAFLKISEDSTLVQGKRHKFSLKTCFVLSISRSTQRPYRAHRLLLLYRNFCFLRPTTMSSATITTNTTTNTSTSTATVKPSCFKERCDIYANENNNQTRFVNSSRLCSLRSGSEQQRFYQRRFGGSRSYVLRSKQDSYLCDSQDRWEEGWCFESQSSIIPGGPIYRVPGPKQQMRRRFDSTRSTSSRFALADAAAACAASFATHI